jgi:hypothetical protein
MKRPNSNPCTGITLTGTHTLVEALFLFPNRYTCLMALVRAVLRHSLQVTKKAQHKTLHLDMFSELVDPAVLLDLLRRATKVEL